MKKVICILAIGLFAFSPTDKRFKSEYSEAEVNQLMGKLGDIFNVADNSAASNPDVKKIKADVQEIVQILQTHLTEIKTDTAEGRKRTVK
jgi:hypothetical protein